MANSSYRNVGTTAINPTLAAELRRMTTSAPTVSSATIMADTVLAARTLLDTDPPDLGYHYQPADWALNNYTVNGVKLLLTNGVALMTFGDNGLWLGNNAQLTAEGTPLNPVRVFRFNVVQEQSIEPATRYYEPNAILGPSSATVWPTANLRFVQFSGLGGYGFHLYSGWPAYMLQQVSLRDCQFTSGKVSLWSGGGALSTVNNLFEGVETYFGGAADTSGCNNLFRRGIAWFGKYGGTWAFTDNSFHDAQLTDTTLNIPNQHNAYIGTTKNTRLWGSSGGDVLLDAFSYESGPLGRYYQPSSSPLIDQGSRTAAVAGLCQHTVQADQTKETGPVDIGFHCVATQSYRAAAGFSPSVNGANGWHYQSAGLLGQPGTDLTYYDSVNSCWAVQPNEYCWVGDNWQHPGFSHDSVRAFQVPTSGSVRIDGVAYDYGDACGGDGARVRVLRNSTTLINWTAVAEGTSVGSPVALNYPGPLAVNAGDYLYFQVNENVNNLCDRVVWDPRVSYYGVLADTDGDGLADYFEDANGDGSAAGDTYAWNNPDTDGDGLGDLQEWELSYNVLVNDPAQDYGTEQNTQFESTCSVLNGKVIVAYVDSKQVPGPEPRAGGVYALGQSSLLPNRVPRLVGYAVSEDQGTTFSEKGKPPLSTQGPGSSDDGDAGDPVLAVDTQAGIVYLAGTSPRNAGWKGIPLWKSTDGGVTFGDPITVRSDLAGTDKPWIAVDNAAGTGQGDVYLTFTEGGPPAKLWLVVSTDHGLSWNRSQQIQTGEAHSAIPAVATDHVAYVFWWELSGGAQYLKVRKVRNRGLDLDPPSTVCTLVTTALPYGNLALRRGNDAAADDTFRAFPWPVVAVNPSPTKASHLYAAYADKAQSFSDPDNKSDVFLVRSADAGANWTSPTLLSTVSSKDQWMPVLAVKPDGTKLFTAWYDRRNDANNSLMDVYGRWAAIAADGSVSLGTEFRITTVASPPVFAGTLGPPYTSPGYYDPVYPPGLVDLRWWYPEWPDGGTTFSTYRDHVGEYNGACAEGSYVYVSWTDSRLTAQGTLCPRNQRDIRLVRLSWPL